ncbi:MAG TPA: mitochondrial fission ELM1 family protein [Rhodanobacteraceae bacterium]|nr:mitochondrial fission ELM1 family protein [Rhodanobacteraceae bacterium]
MHQAWIITDGRAGNLRQAHALARAAGFDTNDIAIQLRRPWRLLAPHLLAGAQWALPTPTQLLLAPPWPRYIIGCGRQAAWATRWLHQRAAGTSHCVQVLAPHTDPADWDLVIAPRHDGLSGPNVLTPLGSLNPVDSAWLAAARARFRALDNLPQPRTAVLLGGPRRGIAFDARFIRDWADGLRARHVRDGGSFMLSASPRTPAPFAHAIRDALADLPGMAWLGSADGDNPYAGLLAYADRIAVTPDSVNMLSEAAASGAPVHTRHTEPLPLRLARFHAALRDGGWLHDLEADASAPAQPLRETHDIAATMLRRLHA